MIAEAIRTIPSQTPYPTYTPYSNQSQQTEIVTTEGNLLPTQTDEYVFTSTTTPGQELGSRANPVPLGSAFTIISNEGTRYSIRISQVLRGEEASEFVKGEEPDEELKDTQEVLVAYISVEFLESMNPEEILQLYYLSFNTVSNNSINDNYVYLGDRRLVCELFVGGKCEGWAALVVDKDEEQPLILFPGKWGKVNCFFSVN